MRSARSQLEFEEDAIREIAHKAYEKKTGARGLRSILESIMNDLMFEIPSDESITKCVITKGAVTGEGAPLIVRDNEKVKKSLKKAE